MPTKDLVTCPKCGSIFSISYSRAFSCGGCPSATFGSCGYVKCPKCGYEFPLTK